jgi:LSD1 subclass zinc finger protein
MMGESSLEIARSVADAGALYAERRWMQGEADAFKELWRVRLYDTIFAGVLHAIELHEQALSRRRKRRRSMLLLWCLNCRAQLKVPRGLKHSAIRCPTCGNVQTAPQQSRN